MMLLESEVMKQTPVKVNEGKYISGEEYCEGIIENKIGLRVI